MKKKDKENKEIKKYLAEVLSHNLVLRKKAEENNLPILVSGYVMDKTGLISKGEGVPPEIANSDDWRIFMHFLSGADVFFTGMAYIKRVVDKYRLLKREIEKIQPFYNLPAIGYFMKKNVAEKIRQRYSIQDTLFPFSLSKPDNYPLSESFEHLGRWRKENGFNPEYPDIVITTSGLDKYRNLFESAEFKDIAMSLQSEKRGVFIVVLSNQNPNSARSDSHRNDLLDTLARMGVEVVFAKGNPVLEYLRRQQKKNSLPKIIANTTGPRVFQSFYQAAKESGYPFLLHLTVVDCEVEVRSDKGEKAVFFSSAVLKKSRSASRISDWHEDLERMGFVLKDKTKPFYTKNILGESVQQRFFIFAFNCDNCLD